MRDKTLGKEDLSGHEVVELKRLVELEAKAVDGLKRHQCGEASEWRNGVHL